MPASVVKPIGHEDRLSLVEHLDELRSRLVIMAITVVLAFTLCAWQNKALLDFIGKPLATTTEQRTKDGEGPLGGIYKAQTVGQVNALNHIRELRTLVADPTLAKATRTALSAQLAREVAYYRALDKSPPVNKPITIGIGEPFTQTITIAAYFALLISLPILLYQLYAFVLPAFSPDERRVALPLMAMVPFLFAAGVAFGYVIVLPAATKFLQNFNSDQFNVLVQAKDYYKFAILTLVSIGLVFQLPVGLLAVTRTGIVSVQQLRAWRRYAIVATAVLAMILPGTDPVSMILEFLILYALYEVSLVMATFMDRGKAQRAARPSRWDLDDDEDEDDDGGDDDGHDGPGPQGGVDEDDDDDAWVDDDVEDAEPWPDDDEVVAEAPDPVLTPPDEKDL